MSTVTSNSLLTQCQPDLFQMWRLDLSTTHAVTDEIQTVAHPHNLPWDEEGENDDDSNSDMDSDTPSASDVESTIDQSDVDADMTDGNPEPFASSVTAWEPDEQSEGDGSSSGAGDTSNPSSPMSRSTSRVEMVPELRQTRSSARLRG